MSIFGNLDNILVQENTQSNDINISSINSDTDIENYSFVDESYNFVLGYTKSYNEAVKEFYKNIMESEDNQEIITESFEGFFAKAKEIIKKFLAFIKKIFAKFVTKLNSLFKSEKYLEKNKNEFPKFTSEDEFTFKGYKFTLDNDIPKSNAFSMWINNDTDLTYGGSYYAYNGVNNDTVVNQIQSKYDKLTEKLEDWYDEFRGQVIGVDYEISSSEFDTELKKVFRDDYESTIDITIDSTAVQEAYQQFHNYKDSVSKIEKIKKVMEDDYSKLERALETSFKKEKEGDGYFFKFDPHKLSNEFTQREMEKFNSSEISGNNMGNSNRTTNEIYNKIDMYMKAKVTQVNQMSSIHSMAFSAKLQAAKDCFVQNKAILYKALAKIKSHKAVV